MIHSTSPARPQGENNEKEVSGQDQLLSPTTNSKTNNTLSLDEKDSQSLADVATDHPDDEFNVSIEENDLLDQTVDRMDSTADRDQARATLDNTDEDGEPLNESNDPSGNDLDVPGAEDDDDNEEVGEEDEENNSYSLGADKKD